MAREPIHVDDDGCPIGNRPDPYDFADFWEFFDALHQYRNDVAQFANRVFAEQFARSMRD